MCTLRRLFTGPVLSHPIRLNPASGAGGKQTPGWGCGLKMQKPMSLTFHLHILLVNRMVLEVSGVQRRFFGQKSDPNVPVWVRGAEV